MPPKGRKRGGATAPSTPAQIPGTPLDPSAPPSGAQTPVPQAPPAPSPAELLSYLHEPKPFKNPYYNKNVNRRAKTLKAVLNGERERVRLEREKKKEAKDAKTAAEATTSTSKLEGEADSNKMDVDGDANKSPPDDEEEEPTYTSIEAPPSVMPHPHYCDITGLEAPYTDPATRLRYHDKSVYEIIRGLNVTTARDYLAARGVMPIVK